MDISDWDDLRLVLEVARSGSIRRAAHHWQADHTTLSRKLKALQKRVGTPLFERQGRSLQPTEAGQEILLIAHRMEAEVRRANRLLTSRSEELSGLVHLHLPPGFLPLIGPALAEFMALHPGVTLELVPADLDPSNAEISVCIAENPGTSSGHKQVGVCTATLYGHKDLLEAFGSRGLAEFPWISLKNHASLPSSVWIQEKIPSSSLRARACSVLQHFQMVQAGVGIGFVPAMMAHQDPNLRAVRPAPACFSTPVWLLTRDELPSASRVFASWLAETLEAQFVMLRNVARGL